MIEDIRCQGDPDENQDPHSALEQVIIMEQPGPRLTPNEVTEHELEGDCEH
jgi:hypothetical protein